MSQYIYIFVRQNDQFAPIYSSSRSGYLYQALQDFAPYEKIVPLTEGKISNALDIVDAHLESYNSQIKSTYELMKAIEASSDSIDEKRRILSDLLLDIDSYEAEKSDYIEAKSNLEFLKSIANSMSDSIKYEDAAKDLGLYIGIDVGEHVTIEDIE